MKGAGFVYALVTFSGVLSLCHFAFYLQTKPAFRALAVMTLFGCIALKGHYRVMTLKVILENKDERKGKQKSVMLVRTENNLRTTLKIMRMKV